MLATIIWQTPTAAQVKALGGSPDEHDSGRHAAGTANQQKCAMLQERLPSCGAYQGAIRRPCWCAAWCVEKLGRSQV